MEKTIIALRGTANLGKTATIKNVYKLLIKKYPDAKEEFFKKYDDKDITAILIINGVKIGIESQGDPKSRLSKSIDLFVANNCQIIICATRTKGEYVEKVKSQGHEYKVDWHKQIKEDDRTAQSASNLNMAKKLIVEIEKLIKS